MSVKFLSNNDFIAATNSKQFFRHTALDLICYKETLHETKIKDLYLCSNHAEYCLVESAYKT